MEVVQSVEDVTDVVDVAIIVDVVIWNEKHFFAWHDTVVRVVLYLFIVVGTVESRHRYGQHLDFHLRMERDCMGRLVLVGGEPIRRSGVYLRSVSGRFDGLLNWLDVDAHLTSA